jgi:hypothetical protein
VAFGNYGEHATKSKQVSYTITTNKELKNKYNPDFISRCI